MIGRIPLAPYLLAGLLFAPPALAQSDQASADPLNAEAPVPPLHYRSPLASGSGSPDQRVGNWKAANERVEQIGGWQAYAREVYESRAQEAESEAAAPSMHHPAHHPAHSPH